MMLCSYFIISIVAPLLFLFTAATTAIPTPFRGSIDTVNDHRSIKGLISRAISSTVHSLTEKRSDWSSKIFGDSELEPIQGPAGTYNDDDEDALDGESLFVPFGCMENISTTYENGHSPCGSIFNKGLWLISIYGCQLSSISTS